MKNKEIDSVLNDAEREELEQLRAEREVRMAAQKAQELAVKNNLHKIRLDLPPAAGNYINIAGKLFYNGKEYEVSNDMKWQLEEAERRCWSHEASLHESVNKLRKPAPHRL